MGKIFGNCGKSLGTWALTQQRRILTDNFVTPCRLGARRRAWSSPVCLSGHSRPRTVLFGETESDTLMMGSILAEEDKQHHKYSVEQQCFPVYSLLQALHNPIINLFSLDIEGLEYQVIIFTIFTIKH